VGAARALLALQRDVGNRAVAAVLAGSFLQRVPPVAAPVAPPVPVKIGYIYTVRGTINGKAVVYSGQTAREVAQRLYKDKHTDWDNLTVVLTLTDSAAALGVSEPTVTSMYACLFQAALLIQRVPPRSAPLARPASPATRPASAGFGCQRLPSERGASCAGHRGSPWSLARCRFTRLLRRVLELGAREDRAGRRTGRRPGGCRRARGSCDPPCGATQLLL
jgi:hypothetical protein